MKVKYVSGKGSGEKSVEVAGAKTEPICGERPAYASVSMAPETADAAEESIVRNKANLGRPQTKVAGPSCKTKPIPDRPKWMQPSL